MPYLLNHIRLSYPSHRGYVLESPLFFAETICDVIILFVCSKELLLFSED